MFSHRRPASARALVAACCIAVAVAAVACGDATRPTAPPVARASTAAAARGDTSYLPAARVGARLLALSLAEPSARARLRDALRRSPLATHRLALDREVASPRGTTLVRDVAAAARIAEDSVRHLFTRTPLDLLLPRAADRRDWRPERALMVGVADRWRDRPRVFYSRDGDSVTMLDAAAGSYVVVTPAGDRSRRVAPQRDVAGDAVEESDDGTLSGTLSYVSPRGDTARLDVADLIPNYRVVAASAPPAERARALAELRADRARPAGAGGPRRLVACLDVCDGGSLVTWKDTTYLVAFYERGDGEVGADPTYEPWYDGYYRGSKWRLQFNGVPGNAVIFVDVPFVNARPADHSVEGVRIVGGDDNGWWPDGACVVPGMQFHGARYTRNYLGGVSLTSGDQYAWRHCGAYQGADEWGAMLRWTGRSRPAVASLRVEFDTTYMSATSLSIPGLSALPKYMGAYRSAYSGCPSIYYLVGHSADGEQLDSTSLSVLASATSSFPSVATPSRPFNGIMRNYTLGTTALSATIDGVTAQASYGVAAYVTAASISPAARGVAVGAGQTESFVWSGASGKRCAMKYANVAALRPTWTSSSPSLAIAPSADTSTATVTATALGSYTVTATLGPLVGSASIVAEAAPTSAPLLRGTFTTSGALLTWSAVTGARSYDVWRRLDGGAWEYYGSTSGTSWADNTLVDYAYGGSSPGTAGTEDFEVAASNYGGTGPMSNAAGFQLSSSTGGPGIPYLSRRATGTRSLPRP